MEATDRTILQCLSRDGRMSFTDLGKATGLSTSAVHQRVKRLEERGVIRGYRAVLDAEEVGAPLTAIIAIAPLDPAGVDDIPEQIRDITQIESCYSVAGDMSYLLKVRVASPGELETLISRIRVAGNVSTRTTVVLSTAWEDRSTL